MASRSEAVASPDILAHRYADVRTTTESLAAPLTPEDCVVQSMPDVSPTKWHLAHVTWFFEHFVVQPHLTDYRVFHPGFDHLFNSYYHTAGTMHARANRGLLSRPTFEEVMDYRHHVDSAMHTLIKSGINTDLEFLITLGLNHERQHQELLLTDIKHVLAQNPLRPAYDASLPQGPSTCSEIDYVSYAGGRTEIGAGGDDFGFDNETPRHEVLLQPFELGSRLVTNGEYRAFVEAGSYKDPALWLADGWANILAGELERPLYWSPDLQSEFTLAGDRDLNLAAPVTHVSYYEADAYARWAGARLPTEAEWENVAASQPVKGNLMDSGALHPVASTMSGMNQLYGDVWEWSQSGYQAYPGFTPLAGSLGEYNGKFMVSQQVVRGGSCATAADHIRASYRSFFYPDARWQFLGLRLARSA